MKHPVFKNMYQGHFAKIYNIKFNPRIRPVFEKPVWEIFDLFIGRWDRIGIRFQSSDLPVYKH
jgi:hypothetical protein